MVGKEDMKLDGMTGGGCRGQGYMEAGEQNRKRTF